MTLTIKVWRQADRNSKGKFVSYKVTDVLSDMSFLEMLDVMNEQIIASEPDIIKVDNEIILSDFENNTNIDGQLYINLQKEDHSFKSLEEINFDIIKILQIKFNDDIKKIASILKIGKSTIYRKLQKTENND